MEELNYWSAETSISAGDSVENGFSMGAPHANSQAKQTNQKRERKHLHERASSVYISISLVIFDSICRISN